VVSGRRVVRDVFDLLGGVQTALLVIGVVVALLYFTATNAQFLSSFTILSILLSSSWFGILAVGTTFALAAGAADFSIMATTALSGLVAAGVSGALSPVIGVPAAILAAMAIGLLNGVIVVRYGVNGFLATLVMAGAVRGVDYLLGKGNVGIAVTDDFMGQMLATEIGPFPVVFGLVLILAIGGAFVMRWTRFGRTLLAVGGSPTAARLAGLDPSRTVTIGYLISGAAAGVGGIVLASRLGAGIPNAAANQELSLFGAVLIAGTSIWGGRANVVGSIVAILLLQIIYTGLVLSGYPERLQPILASILLLASVWYVQSDTVDLWQRLRPRRPGPTDPGPPTRDAAGTPTTTSLPTGS
jgi:ribose/xylose/arabinose/galactoside ABC-type transport system permease subunit